MKKNRIYQNRIALFIFANKFLSDFGIPVILSIELSSKNMGDLTYKRPEWEQRIRPAGKGEIFYKTILDDAMFGGPIERTVEYVAPFDLCDHEKDYEIA